MRPLISPSTSPLPHLTRLVWLDETLALLLEQHLPEHGKLIVTILEGTVQNPGEQRRVVYARDKKARP